MEAVLVLIVFIGAVSFRFDTLYLHLIVLVVERK